MTACATSGSPLNVTPAHLPCSAGSRSSATAKRRRLISPAFIGALLFSAAAPPAFALDDHNPIGIAGVFEGMITTACAYNVLNHNARREIDDIVVPGSIGKYPLKMTRYYNSRRTISYGLMGPGWSYEYLWISYNGRTDYPNGNVWDNHCTGDWGLGGPLGVSDWPTSWNGYPAFRLADGGTVVFENPNWAVATKIIDPYGQVTTITINSNTGLTTQVRAWRQIPQVFLSGSRCIHAVNQSRGARTRKRYGYRLGRLPLHLQIARRSRTTVAKVSYLGRL